MVFIFRVVLVRAFLQVAGQVTKVIMDKEKQEIPRREMGKGCDVQQ